MNFIEEIKSKIDEFEKQLEIEPSQEWIVDTINVSKKFKDYQKQLLSTLSSIIAMVWPCPYATFTNSEWQHVIDSNPHKTPQPILTESLLSYLYK
ncbi:2677_t:CDS:2 [Entrophospora sp. SA101]|nr:2677_t:CDS:2 [Entrophospora sp. SA101]